MWQLSDVCLTHPKAPHDVLSSVSLNIDDGEQLVILGASGAGKSTLLRCFAGDLAPRSGTFLRDGHDVYGGNVRSYQRDVAIIRQTGDLVPRLSARVNILVAVANQWHLGDLARILMRQPVRFDAAVTALAVEHGVKHLLDIKVEQLSGGERQRVALLQALLRQPQLILADEPTTGLDPATATAALQALRSIAGVTLVVATHDLRVATTFERMIALKHGRVVHDGAPLASDALRDLYATDVLE